MVSQYDVTVGAEVITSDGDRIGEVKELQGSYFKVAADMQPDYWLDQDAISEVNGTRVVLAFDKDHLGDFKYDSPDAKREFLKQ